MHVANVLFGNFVLIDGLCITVSSLDASDIGHDLHQDCFSCDCHSSEEGKLTQEKNARTSNTQERWNT